MAAVADLERLLERVFERTSARIFRSRVQPVQVEHQVERVMEAARSGHGQAVMVPWRFRVRMHPADLEDLAARSGDADVLAGRLAASALAFARAHGYHVAHKPVVDLGGDLSLARGRIEVDAVAEHGAVREQPAPQAVPVAMTAAAARSRFGPTPTTDVLAVFLLPVPATAAPPPPEPVVIRTAAPEPAPAPDLAALVKPGLAIVALEPSGPRADAGHANGLRRDVGHSSVAVLRLTDRVGRDRLLVVGGAAVTIGRASECGLELADAKISRLHGRLELRRGALWYTDLGSRNGSRVNATVMDEAMLAVGDRLTLGDCVLVIESLPT
jgi:nitroreductase